MLTLGILAAIIRNPAMMHELESGYDNYGQQSELLPTPLSKIDPPYAYRDHSLNYRKYTNAVSISFGCLIECNQSPESFSAFCSFGFLGSVSSDLLNPEAICIHVNFMTCHFLIR